MTDLLEVTLRVVAALDASGIPYTVGGSLASSFSGEPRASIDADILVDMNSVRSNRSLTYWPTSSTRMPTGCDEPSPTYDESHSSQVRHQDRPVRGPLMLDTRQLERRRQVRVANNPDRFL